MNFDNQSFISVQKGYDRRLILISQRVWRDCRFFLYRASLPAVTTVHARNVLDIRTNTSVAEEHKKPA